MKTQNNDSAKISNKKESEKVSKFIHAFIDSNLQADA